MCGIAGFVLRSGRADGALLGRMLSAIGHRGPDCHTGMLRDNAALGCARLSIVDLKGGVQPAITDDRGVAVAFNGEIFNYMDLRRDLMRRGVAFRTRSEVETLLNLYLVYGEEFVRRLSGQYAIAVWDGRNEMLLLYRDRFGIRPVFWHSAPEGLLFASEIKALLAYGIDVRLDRAALVQTFRFWTTVGETTAFQEVKQVPPAHYLVADHRGVRLERYWEWPFPETVAPVKLSSDGEYYEAFVEKFDAALARQQMADVPVASYLSGGIDSSVVAIGLHRERQGARLRTYSVTFEDPEYDESAAQRAVTEHFGLDHRSVSVGYEDIAEIFPQVVWQVETPLFRTAPVPLFLLSRRVHNDGLKVVMTGEGADEILLGYDLFRETAIRRFWQREPEALWRASLFRRLYHYLPQYRNPRYFNLLLDFYRPTLQRANDPHFAMAVRWSNGKALEGYFSPEMRAWAETYDPVDELNRWLPEAYHTADDIARAQCIEVVTLLSNYLLSSQGDRMSMAHGVEGRYPYLDDEFVQFAAGLPRRIKLRGMKDKFILRNAYGDLVPPQVRARPKVAYQAPDLKGFFADGRAPGWVEELLSPEQIVLTGLFDPERVVQLVTKARSHKLPRAGNRDNMALLLVLSTMLLDEIFVRRSRTMRSDVPVPQTIAWV